MKIAVLVPSLANLGPVIVARDLCEYFTKNNHICDVYYFDEIKELDFPCRTYKINFFTRIEFDIYDIIHVHCIRPAMYLAINKHRIKRSKCVTTLHQPITKQAYMIDGYNSISAYFVSMLSKIIYNKCDCSVFLSDIQKRLSNDLIHNRKEIIHNGRNISPNAVKSPNDIEKIKILSGKYKIIGSISVINRRKGLDQMIKALRILDEYAFVCVGDGPELDNLKQLSLTLGVDDRCLWLGYQPDAAIYYKYFDLFVMCTHSEGYPLALIEAAANKNACVLSDIDILKYIIPQECAFFYHLNDIDSLADKIKTAYEKREILRSNLYQFYCENLTADTMGEKYIKLFNDLISK